MQRRVGFGSIRWQMALGYFAVSIIGFILILLSSSRIIRNFLIEQRTQEIQSAMNIVAQDLKDEFLAKDSDQLFTKTIEYATKYEGHIVVLDRNAVVQVDSASELNGQRFAYDEVANVLWGNKNQDFEYHHDPTEIPTKQNFLFKLKQKWFPERNWALYYVHAIENDGQTIGAVLFSTSIQDVIIEVYDISQSIGFLLLIILIVTVVMSWFLSLSISKPISELTQVIKRMARGELNLRVKLKGSRELVDLGKTFNDMSERLGQTEQVRNEFVSSASHEIKTPLATMKILVESILYQEKFDEAMVRDFLSDVDKEINRLDAVITDLLRLVQVDKLEGDTGLKRETLRIDQICSEAIKRLTPIAKKRQIRLSYQLEPSQVIGDPIKLEQAIFNVIDNAIKYTDNSGIVKVECLQESNFAVIHIEDNGIGIPEKDIANIFQRFYRVDKARSRQTGGTGLGLAIVERIIKLHGGTIVVKSIENEGTIFIISIPLA